MSVKQLMSAEELWTMPEVPGKRFELINGELREVPGAGGLHGLIVVKLIQIFLAITQGNKKGRVFADGVSFVLRTAPDTVRVPDVSYIAPEHIPATGIPVSYIRQAPDLAIEVVSPEDRATELREKARDYLEAGTMQVWVLWPGERTVTVYMQGHMPSEFGPEDTLDGGDLLPGFRVKVADLFDVE